MSPKSSILPSVFAWLVALSLTGYAGFLGWGYVATESSLPEVRAVAQAAVTATPHAVESDQPVRLPPWVMFESIPAVGRKAELRTLIPTRPSVAVQTHTVEFGDSVFEIAALFKIKPETLLWANYDLLNDNPDMISVGMELLVPPIDGVYYEWQAGDTLESVAGRFEADQKALLSWSGNPFDLTNPALEPGTLVMVPGGHREFRQWIIPVIPRGAAGVSRAVYGAGACDGSYEGAYGSGGFIWPASNHSLSGNDYWSGHLAIDIAAGEGAQVYAADSGVVVFSGWSTGGYGNMIMIDHGNGYQTVYGHLSSTSAGCGRSVGQGSIIGYAGSTGNSTGAHLHFEVRYLGGFVNPWYVLPAP